MNKQKLISAFIILPSFLFASDFPFFRKQQNRFKHGERHGLWIIYNDAGKTMVQSRGRYKKGNEKGVWRYYNENRKIRKKEVYRFKKIKTINYFPDGKVNNEGKARLVKEGENLHFYYYGDWKYYSEDGKLSKIVTYEKGKQIGEKNIIKE